MRGRALLRAREEQDSLPHVRAGVPVLHPVLLSAHRGHRARVQGVQLSGRHPRQPLERLSRTSVFLQVGQGLVRHHEHVPLQPPVSRPVHLLLGAHADPDLRDEGRRFKKTGAELHVPAVLHFLGRRRLIPLQPGQLRIRDDQPAARLPRREADQRLRHPPLLVLHPSVRVHLEMGRVRQRPLPRRHHGHRSGVLRGGDDRRGERVPEDVPHHAPACCGPPW